MKDPKYKVGDMLWTSNWLDGYWNVYVKSIKKTWFGYKYFCKWTVNDYDYGQKYEKMDFIREGKLFK